MHERSVTSKQATGTALSNAKGGRVAGSQPGVTSAPARTHLPNRQELRLSGKCAPSSPLRLMVTRRAEDAMVRLAVSSEPVTAPEGGVASQGSSQGPRAGPLLSWSSPALPAAHRVQPALEPSAPQPRRTDHGHPWPSLRPDPHSRRSRPWCPPPAARHPPPAARLPVRSVRQGGSAPRLPAAPARFKRKRRFKFWR